MTGHVNVSGTWKTIDSISVKVSGAWKTVTNGYVKVSGVWKEFFTSFTVALADFSLGAIVLNPGVPSCSFTLNTDGTSGATGSTSSIGSWGSPTTTGVGSGYWVRLTVNTGASPSGSAVGSWLQLSSARTWTWVGEGTGTFTVQIATDSGGSNIVDTASGDWTNVIVFA